MQAPPTAHLYFSLSALAPPRSLALPHAPRNGSAGEESGGAELVRRVRRERREHSGSKITLRCSATCTTDALLSLLPLSLCMHQNQRRRREGYVWLVKYSNCTTLLYSLHHHPPTPMLAIHGCQRKGGICKILAVWPCTVHSEIPTGSYIALLYCTGSTHR
jgi:hypothetical protein